MGKVRTEKVKKVARELVQKYPDKFNTDFENNKKNLDAMASIYSTKLRNRIAGYVTRLMAIAKASAETESSEGAEEEKEEEETD